MSADPIRHIENAVKETNTFMGKKTKGVLERYPLIFSSLIVFGVVATLHGFESVIAQIPYLNEHPMLVFGIGLFILIVTGSLYKWLEKKTR